MGSLSIGHWAIVLVVVMLVFGTRKLRDAGSDVGRAVKGFRDELRPEGPAESVRTEMSVQEAHKERL